MVHYHKIYLEGSIYREQWIRSPSGNIQLSEHKKICFDSLSVFTTRFAHVFSQCLWTRLLSNDLKASCEKDSRKPCVCRKFSRFFETQQLLWTFRQIFESTLIFELQFADGTWRVLYNSVQKYKSICDSSEELKITWIYCSITSENHGKLWIPNCRAALSCR